MAGLTGKQIAESYKDLLQLDNSNGGLTATTRNVKDGDGTASPLQLSNSAVNINGTFQLSGVTLTASAEVLNAVADLTGATGMVAVSGGQVYGRTLTAGTGLSITNADGTEGNPTFSLNASGVVAGTYGPFSNFEVNQHGQVVSAATVNTSVSIPTLRADEIVGGTITLSSQASIGGDLNVDGAGTIDGIVSLADDLYVSGSTYIRTNLSVTGNTRTDFLYAVSASIEDARIGTLNFTDVSVSSFTASNLTVVSVVSVGTAILLAGDNVATSAGLATVSSALATSISTANTRVTSVSDFAVALSATMATSIANHLPLAGGTLTGDLLGTNITLSGDVSAVAYWGSGSHLTGVQASIPASVATSADLAAANARITSVSDFAVALSATFATSISRHLPLAGGILNGNVAVSVIDNTNAALRITQLGTGNALLVEDSANPDSTPFVITAAGDVGIGTSSPNARVKIVGDNTESGITLRLDGGSVQTQRGVVFAVGGADYGFLNIPVGGGGAMSFGTGSAGAAAERMRITSAGNVGIGTTDPASKFEVFGNSVRNVARASTTAGEVILEAQAFDYWSGPTYTGTSLRQYGSTATGTTAGLSNASLGSLYFQNGSAGLIATNGSTPLVFATTSAERMRITGAGNVGIGTASPAVPLQISSATPAIRLTDTDDNSDAQVGAAAGGLLVLDADIGNEAAGTAILFRVDGGSEKMRIDSSGRVGIGTASPDLPLAVSGSIGSTGSLFLRGQSTGDQAIRVGSDRTGNGNSYIDLVGDTTYTFYGLRLIRGNTGANAASSIQHRGTGLFNIVAQEAASIVLGTANTERMRIDSSGKVGIGTSSPGEKLNVSTGGSEYAIQWNSTGSNNWVLGSASNRAYIANKSTPLEVLTLLNGGNVGIGTSSPDGKLDIATGGTTDVVAALGGTFPAFTYRNGTGSWFHAGKHPSSDYFYIGRGGTPTTNVDVVVDSSGNVGIATTTPNAKLGVNAGALGTSDGNQLEQARFTSTNSNASYLRIFTERDGAGSDWNTAFTRIQQRIDATDMGYIQFNGADNLFGMSFGKTNTEYMRINTSGNVGIGTASPSTALEVNGTITATTFGTDAQNAYGARNISTSDPTGGSDGDIWYKY